jgi:hypothetical protein
MDFTILIIFLGLYYLRPQEWWESFNFIHPIELLSFLAFWAMFVIKKLKPRDLFFTPTDWMVVGYFVTTLISGFQFMTNLGYIEAVLLFYFLAACSLDSIPRLITFLKWWCWFILVIAGLAIASQFGIDPFDSNAMITGYMKGRLILNLSVFNNPNSLAHGIVPAVPLLYYLLFWRRIFMKAGLILMAIPLYCIYLTQSKGAVLCGFATLLATLTFGRSKFAQVIILILAMGLGYGALYKLPRMNELSHAQSDAAIQGRVAALSYGMEAMKTHFFGIGFGNFPTMFYHFGPMERIRVLRHSGQHSEDIYVSRHYYKATHGSYNQTGAEFGYPGLFFFVGIMYCCIRTLLLVKSEDDDEERIRRVLFAMVVAYACSSWMVDFCYRPTFFMFVAAISAFHRHLLRKQAAAAEPVEAKPAIPDRPWLRRLLPPIKLPGIPIPELASPVACMAEGSAPAAEAPSVQQAVAMEAPPGALIRSRQFPTSGRVLPWHKKEFSLEETLRKKFIWNRLGLLDLVLMLGCFYGTILYWQHLIKTM